MIIVPQAEALEEILEPIGTMVVVEDKHSRGVKNTIAMTTTSAVRGIFAEKAEARAIELAKKGINLMINYVHSQKEAEETAAFITKTYGVKVLVLQGDMANRLDVQRVTTESIAKMGGIDILVHNAGPFIREKKTISEYTIVEWQQMMDGNLNSFFYLLKALLPVMQAQRWGRIVMLGFDRVGQAPAWKYRGAYAAAKTGSASLIRTLALEESDNGITVNMVCPGDITGPWKEMMIEDARRTTDIQMRPQVGEDIARTVAFLCEDNADMISGAIIEVTGGKDVLAKRNQE